MKPFESFHPFTNFIFFFLVILFTGIMANPLLTALSCLLGVITFYAFKKKEDHSFGPLFAFCLLAGLINPLVSHEGATILFYINTSPVTQEACIYGVHLALQLLQLILWFKILSLSLTSDHIMCLFGKISPRLSLLFSMVLRFVPEFSAQMRSMENAAKVMGMYSDDTIISRIKGKSRIFLSVAGYSLEHGIITADSMEARGYSLPHRTSYQRFSFHRRDYFMLGLIVLLSIPLIIALFLKVDRTVFYPLFKLQISAGGLFMIVLPAFILLCIPLIILLREEGRLSAGL